MVARKGTPEYEAWKNSPAYEQWRQNNATSQKKKWSDPEYKQKAVEHTLEMGKNPSPETRAKMSASRKGGNSGSFKKGQTSLNKGKTASPETRAKLSASHKGKIPPNKGKRMSVEMKAKMIAENKGNIWTPEEDALLREKYLTHTSVELSALLPGRSPSSITLHAADIGLVKHPRSIRVSGYSSDFFLPEDGEKECAECGMIKPYNQFYRVKHKADGYHSRCRACHRKSYNYVYNGHKKRPGPHRPTEIIPEGYKRCLTCREVKPHSAFMRNIKNKDGVVARCKDCSKTTAEQNRENNLKVNYGITPAEYDAMLATQNGVCACCGKSETARFANGRIKPLAVDHCHQLEVVRGLLCHQCNAALGLLCENPDRVKALLKYVEERCIW